MSVVQSSENVLWSDAPFDQYLDEIFDRVPVLEQKIINATKLDQTLIRPLFNEVLKFLFLIGKENLRLTPSHVVDLAWHEFILCTRVYHDFCDEHFQRYIHHHPGGDEGKNLAQFELTHKIYNERFGTPPKAFWGVTPSSPKEDSCGVCEAI